MNHPLIRAFLHDPSPGLLLTGDPLLQEQLLGQVLDALRERYPVAILPRHAPLAALCGHPDPLSALQGGPARRPGLLEREGLLVIPAAHLLEPAVAVAAARAPRLLAAAPSLADLHPALRERLAAVLSLPDHPPAGGPEPAPDPAALVAWFDGASLCGHRLELLAAQLAGALAETGGPVRPCLERYLLAPRGQAPPPPAGQPPPPPRRGDANPGPIAPEPPDSTQPPQPPEPPEPGPPPPPSPPDPSRPRARRPAEGRRGPVAPHPHRGRLYRTTPDRGRADLALLPTLMAAAPWQRLRAPAGDRRLRIRPADLRFARRRRRSGRLTILLVDASGSMAQRAIRLAKGAAVALLREAYQHRHRVAIVLIRGAAASVGLWPTRSVERARSCLRALPTGGGTPLASGLLLAARLAAPHDPAAVQAVLLTDGRANLGLQGDPRQDALRALALLRQRAGELRLVDLGPRYGAGTAWLRLHLSPSQVTPWRHNT